MLTNDLLWKGIIESMIEDFLTFFYTFKPDTYKREFLKTRLEYSFPICKVIEQDATILEQSNNPFAMVILATLIELKKGSTDDEGIKNIKRRLIRLMFDKNFTKEKIRTLFAFINQYIRFAKIENTRIFASEIAITYQSHPNNMGLLEIIREHDLNEAKKQGLEQGLEQGFEKGVETVILSAYQNGISPVLISEIVKQPLDKVMAIIEEHFPTERKD